MAHNNNPINPPVNTQAMAQVVAAAVNNGSNDPVQKELMQLLAKKLKKELEAEETDDAQKAAARKANADNMVLVHEQERLRQNACGHTKPRNMGSALAGQRTHKGYYVYVCQYCGKNFSNPPQRPEEAVPPELFPDGALVGGPHQ